MISINQHVDTAYLCFQITPQSSAFQEWLSSRKSEESIREILKSNANTAELPNRTPLYLNCDDTGDSVRLEPTPRTIWTIVPFDASAFYLEVTRSFGKPPMHLSFAKTDRFVLTTFATDGSLFCQREGQSGTGLAVKSPAGDFQTIGITERLVKGGGTCLTQSALDRTRYAPTFTFVHDSRDPQGLVSVGDSTYQHRCLEFFLPGDEKSEIIDNSILPKQFHLQEPQTVFDGTLPLRADECWTATSDIRAGSVICTQNDDIFRSVFLHAQSLMSARVKYGKTDPPSNANVSVSALILGHPLRTFPVYFIFALKPISDGAPVIPQFAFPSDKSLHEEAHSDIRDWPDEEPYFHGIGRHTCGAPRVGYPLHMVAIRDCEQLGRGQRELIAQCRIPKGTLFPYTGAISDRPSPYSWLTNSGHSVLGGGIMRYANVYFGFREEPNAALVDIQFQLESGTDRPVLCVATLEDVPPGEPILVRSYGRDADFEVLRRTICHGRYLTLGDFPPEMRISGLTSREQWYLPGDIVAVRKMTASRKTMEVKLYSIVSIESHIALSVPLQRVQPNGVEFTLVKGQRTERIKLKRCILLIPDEDYDIVQQRKQIAAEQSMCSPKKTVSESESIVHLSSAHPHSWEIGKNRGPVSNDALAAATTVVETSVSISQRKTRKRPEPPLLTVRLSRSVYFVLFSGIESIHERSAESLTPPATTSAPVRSPLRAKMPRKEKRALKSSNAEIMKGLSALDASVLSSAPPKLDSIDMLGFLSENA